ncbi:hypothetical protein VPEG_00018 [Vibrio phage SIO-2]|uniref:hypothetical protein n=1 Tax=Vibrio phage SIO-2 TaxID=700512 RepID=UPI0002357C38|nr:hypothetical protein VPEG_00018 [Vibrio phage SIO-2]AET42169.1 hypothetical protein VPEG_00018 [Vibrio phage SIO-2]
MDDKTKELLKQRLDVNSLNNVKRLVHDSDGFLRLGSDSSNLCALAMAAAHHLEIASNNAHSDSDHYVASLAIARASLYISEVLRIAKISDTKADKVIVTMYEIVSSSLVDQFLIARAHLQGLIHDLGVAFPEDSKDQAVGND